MIKSMAHLVVAYPKVLQADFDWIQGYRKQNDPRYFSVIKPHFTIVFAVKDIGREAFLEEVKKQAVGIRRFDFELKVATINRDESGKRYHEVLVPDQGYSDLVKLHDQLYAQNLLKYLRFDLDFIPHIGIGKSDDALISKSRVDELNRRGVHISGVIDRLDIVEYEHGVITAVEGIPLI